MTVATENERNTTIPRVTFKRVTPVLFAADVEPCLHFWESLGFSRAMEVPDGNTLAFAAVHNGSLEVMYQSFASAEKDPAASAATKSALRSHAFLYIEVDNLDEILAAMKHAPLEVEPHMTFYGAREVGFRDPAGHFITFAEFAKQQ